MFAVKSLRFKEYIRKFSPLINRFQIPEKWKGGRIEKWSTFWKGIFLDYKAVSVDIIQGAKEKPRKTFIIVSGLVLMLTAIKKNPNEYSFHDQLVQNCTDLIMVGDPIRNPESENHIRYLTKCSNHGVLRRTDMIFFSLMWIADYDKDCRLYSAQCKYLKPRYSTFYQRIIDVGMFETWLNLKLKMRDYDVNPNEWIQT